MEKLNAENFYKKYIEYIKSKDGKEAVRKYYYGSETENALIKKKEETPWTKYVNRTIIPQILTGFLKEYPHQTNISLSKFAYNEFYKIDVTGWTYLDQNDTDKELSLSFNSSGMNWHCWALEAAIEHENDPKDFFYEIIKVLYIDCPLRVVIGYNNISKRDDPCTGDLKKLRIIREQIKQLRKLDCLNRGEFLIIIGNSGGSFDPNIEKMCGYKAYLLKSSGVEQIKQYKDSLENLITYNKTIYLM